LVDGHCAPLINPDWRLTGVWLVAREVSAIRKLVWKISGRIIKSLEKMLGGINDRKKEGSSV
jgi:hypothetical protein